LTQNSNKMFYQIIISMIGFDFGKKWLMFLHKLSLVPILDMFEPVFEDM
jgi:hypothetical protein